MKLSEEQLKRVISSLNPKKVNSTDFEINCPECGHRECGISIVNSKHVWGCYRRKACGASGNIYTLRKYGISFKKEDKTASEFKKISLKVFNEESNEVILSNINMPLGFRNIDFDDYLDSRGFTKKDYLYWGVGRTSIGFLKNYVIFPVSLHGDNKAYVARTHKRDFEPRYKNSVSEFASLLGGYDKFDTCETIILVEGIFDVINITRLLDLYDSESLRSVCTFGAKISDNQINLLKQKSVKKIILMFDGDVVKKIKPIAFELSLYFEVRVVILEGDDIDAGNCQEHHLIEAFENQYNPLEFNLRKIERRIL